MSFHFSYPQIRQAKLALMTAITKESTDTGRVEVIEDWFKRHIFEIGATFHISRDVIKNENTLAQADVAELYKYKAINLLAKEITEKGLYIQQKDEDWVGQNTTFKIFVMGCPQYVGDGTRESQVVLP